MPSNKKRAAVRQRMPAKNRNGLPAYQRIQSAIRKRIDTGQLHPGDAVASERDLAKIHQVSLMTARHALASLEREGIVERRRGIGTFVSAPKIHFNKLMSYTEQMSSRSPLLRIRQIIYSTKGRPIMYVLGFYRSDRHNLVIRRFR